MFRSMENQLHVSIRFNLHLRHADQVQVNVQVGNMKARKFACKEPGGKTAQKMKTYINCKVSKIYMKKFCVAGKASGSERLYVPRYHGEVASRRRSRPVVS